MIPEIQIKILTRILQSEGLRYSEAYPGEEIDDDLYNYHLQELVKKNLLEKIDGKYRLTQEGKVEIQMMDSSGNYQEQFRVSVLMYVLRSNNSQVLMCRRTRWPLRGDVVSPAGKIRRGEKVVEAAKRKLREETDLEADFEFVGALRSIRRVEEKLVEDTIYHVCVAYDPKGGLSEETEFGEFFWSEWEEVVRYNETNVGGSEKQKEILERLRLENKNKFYLEEELELKSY